MWPPTSVNTNLTPAGKTTLLRHESQRAFPAFLLPAVRTVRFQYTSNKVATVLNGLLHGTRRNCGNIRGQLQQSRRLLAQALAFGPSTRTSTRTASASTGWPMNMPREPSQAGLCPVTRC